MGKIATDGKTGNPGLIRYANAGAVLQMRLASELADAFSKHHPAWLAKRNPDVFIFHSDAEVDAGLYAEQNERWVLESRASLLVEGFENPWQLGLPKHSPAAYP